jgi:hypothetical protein
MGSDSTRYTEVGSDPAEAVSEVDWAYRNGHGTGDSGYPQANDKTVRSGAAGWRTFWRLRYPSGIHLTDDFGQRMVRRDGWGGSIQGRRIMSAVVPLLRDAR